MQLRSLTQRGYSARLRWWNWAEIGGATGLIALGILFITGYIPHPAAIAVLLHFAADFTFQSSETALKKRNRGHHLRIHALAAGGFPLAVAATATQDPATVLIWAGLGAAWHYAVDWTCKFGLRNLALAVLLDQACHILIILVLVLAF